MTPQRLLPYLFPILIGLAFATARASTDGIHGIEHSTEHYDLYVEGDRNPAETGAMLEALHRELTRFFGRAPSGRLRVEIYATQERFLAALLRDQQPYEGGGGLYGPSFRKVWLAVQPTEAYTRQLILHEAAHQFHFLVATGNEFPSALWYTEGLAEYMAMANWDGQELEVGVVPAITLEDYPRRARARLNEIGWDLEGAIEGRVELGQAGSWALVHYLAHRDPRRFRRLGARLDRREPAASAFRATYGSIDEELVHGFRHWLRNHRQPWEWHWNSWQQRGDWIEGESAVVAVSTLKQTPRRLEVELQPLSGYFKGGVVFGYRSQDDFYMMTVWDDRGLRIVRRLGQQWIGIDRFELERPVGRDVLAVERTRTGFRLFANGRVVTTLRGNGQVGLTVDGCRALFRTTIFDGDEPGYARGPGANSLG